MANHTRIRGYEHDQEGTASRGEKRRYRWASEVGYQDLRTGCLSLNEKGLCTHLIFATQPNWEYAGGSKNYANDVQYNFGTFRRPDRPIPTELRDPRYYHRRGSITANGWDTYPENQHGDIVSLKDYANDDDQTGSELIDILIKSHCYWIREADIDGFRVDAVKHMEDLACSRFCSNIREYAYSLGKRGFFLFGELAVSGDDIYDRYIGQNTSIREGNRTVFFGFNSLLDFRLAMGFYGDDDNAPLRQIITGIKGPATLFNRLAAQQYRALNRGENGRYLVTF